MVSTVENCNYIIDWEFKQTGTIKVTVGMTGLLEVDLVDQFKSFEEAIERSPGHGDLACQPNGPDSWPLHTDESFFPTSEASFKLLLEHARSSRVKLRSPPVALQPSLGHYYSKETSGGKTGWGAVCIQYGIIFYIRRG